MENEVRQPASDLAPFRRAIDGFVVRLVDDAADWLVAHWLLLANAGVAVFALLPFVAPYLLSVGLHDLARVIYAAYSYTCHQLPERSYFVFGHQMAYCQRDTATYVAVFLAGLAFALRKDRRRTMSLKLYLLLILPLAVDGTTQLVGLRESTWLLRTISGGLFGAASAWLAYPFVQRAMEGS